MAQYIDKSALMAEIERLIDSHKPLKTLDPTYCEGLDDSLDDVLSFLNTLEVKEVDLELNSFDATVCKNCSTYLKEMDKDAIVKALEQYKNGDKVKVIIKAQKGE